MKLLKTTLAVFMAAAVLASCSKDDSTGKGTNDGVETYMSITLKTADATTRAHHGDLAATKPESQIHTATIYVIDDKGFLEEVVTFDPGVKTKTFTVTTGAKTFLAAINIPNLPSFDKGTTHISKMQEAKIDVADITVPVYIDSSNPDTDSKFWMTTLDESNTAVLEEITDPTQVANSANDVTITVGRAVAKVGVYYKPQVTPEDGELDATTVKWKAHNNPNKMMLFPSKDAAGNRVTPYYNASTIVEANYFHNTGYRVATKTNDATLGREVFTDPYYMMENSNLDPSQKNATFVMVQGNYKPKTVIDPDDESENTYTSGSFWRIAKVNAQGIRTAWLDGYYSKDPDVANNSSSQITLAADEESFEYTGGTAYYGLWAMNDTENGTVNRYTVKRNQYWSFEITSVSGCGEPDEKGVTDPDEKVDAETYMTATIEVKAWEDVDRPGGI